MDLYIFYFNLFQVEIMFAVLGLYVFIMTSIFFKSNTNFVNQIVTLISSHQLVGR